MLRVLVGILALTLVSSCATVSINEDCVIIADAFGKKLVCPLDIEE